MTLASDLQSLRNCALVFVGTHNGKDHGALDRARQGLSRNGVVHCSRYWLDEFGFFDEEPPTTSRPRQLPPASDQELIKFLDDNMRYQTSGTFVEVESGLQQHFPNARRMSFGKALETERDKAIVVIYKRHLRWLMSGYLGATECINRFLGSKTVEHDVLWYMYHKTGGGGYYRLGTEVGGEVVTEG